QRRTASVCFLRPPPSLLQLPRRRARLPTGLYMAGVDGLVRAAVPVSGTAWAICSAGITLFVAITLAFARPQPPLIIFLIIVLAVAFFIFPAPHAPTFHPPPHRVGLRQIGTADRTAFHRR